MTTIADQRSLLRSELKDTDALNYRWTDADLDQAIQNALADYSLLLPKGATEVLPAVAGEYAYTPTTPRLVAVTAVECPADLHPPAFVSFTFDGANVRIFPHSPPRDGDSLRLWLACYHSIDASSSTVPAHHEALLRLGAQSYALAAWAAHAVNRINVSPWTVKHFQTLAEQKLRQFRRALERLRDQDAQRAESTVVIAGYEI